MSSHERDVIALLFEEALQPYAEASPPAGAWHGIERRLHRSTRRGWPWQEAMTRFFDASGVSLDTLITPSFAPYSARMEGAWHPIPFISAMTTWRFALRGIS